MTQVVKARCPHCQNVLRIPAEWLTQAMRCKHCQKTFQAKASVPAAPAVSAVVPTAKAASAPAAVAQPAKLAAAITPKAPAAIPVAAAIPASIPQTSSGNLFEFDHQEASPSPDQTENTKSNLRGDSRLGKAWRIGVWTANLAGFAHLYCAVVFLYWVGRKGGVLGFLLGDSLVDSTSKSLIVFWIGLALGMLVTYIRTGPVAVSNEPSPPAGTRFRKKGFGLLYLVDTCLLFGILILALVGSGAFSELYYRLNPSRSEPRKELATNGTDQNPTSKYATKVEKQFVSADKVAPPTTDGPPKKTTTPQTEPKKKPRKELKKKTPKNDGNVTTPKKKFFASDPFPRRALLISVNNYLMFSTVQYGDDQDAVKNGYPGSSTAVLRDRLTRPPMNFPATQVYELSDGVPAYSKTAQPHSTQKSVLETTIQDFLDTCRDQDRILIVFAGHGAYLEEQKASYLVPIDGNLRRPESLVPLKWVYEKLAKCRAQQKVLVLDVFRYSPSRGFELPSPGEGEKGTMPDGFDKDLLNPPPGVQVWSSCVKEQSAVELERGSAFMQALCHALQGSLEMTGISSPTEPLPIESLVGKVNQRLQELVMVEKETQLSRLTGKRPATELAYNRDEPLPPRFDLKPPTAGGAKAAPSAFVSSMLSELSVIPVVRQTRTGDKNLLRADNFTFAADKLLAYKPDGYQDLTELEKKYTANPEAFAKDFPLRAAYFDALDALRKSAKLQMREVLNSPIDPKRKAAFLLEQDPIGRSIFELKGALASVNEAIEKRDMETSKRWQANFDYMQARLQSRLVYLFEYSYKLGQIRADALPELGPGQTGWRIGTNRKITVTEAEAKAYVKDIKKLWKRIQDQYPDTPWDILAQRESMISLGLSWRPKSD